MCVLILVCFFFCFLRYLHTHVDFLGQILMKKFVTLGTECVEYLKATMASEGNLLSYALPSEPFFAVSFDLIFPVLNCRCFGDKKITLVRGVRLDLSWASPTRAPTRGRGISNR
jgi:hypothetical protein